MDDKVVNLEANPIRERILANLEKIPSSKQKAEIHKWRKAFWLAIGIISVMFIAYESNTLGRQTATRTVTLQYTQELDTQTKENEIALTRQQADHALQLRDLRQQHQEEMESAQQAYDATLENKAKAWAANLARVKRESSAQIEQARERVSQVEQTAAAQKAEANQQIQELIQINEQFKAYYEAPAHQRAADIIWPNGVRNNGANNGTAGTTPTHGNGEREG